ncbi:hypothetical protein Prudu_007468 [Prunus dulcis]|uniref:Uncharacterized protein n=1 Tax=Prunus dulcis TaxID=3755 RepID=A0A4Y1R248_PRUDU|nr:hypothetical protein Prudu_007468 [Prunus dulcis]
MRMGSYEIWARDQRAPRFTNAPESDQRFCRQSLEYVGDDVFRKLHLVWVRVLRVALCKAAHLSLKSHRTM